MNIECRELNITSYDIEKEEDINKLKYYKRHIDLISGDIKSKIQDYKVSFIETGVSGDYEWLKKAKSKCRLYGFLSQTLQARIGYVNKTQNDKVSREVERLFVDNAKEILTKDVFDLILSKSIERAKKQY